MPDKPTLKEYQDAMNALAGDKPVGLLMGQLSLAASHLGGNRRAELSRAASESEGHAHTLLDQWFGHFLPPEVKEVLGLIARADDWQALEALAREAGQRREEAVIVSVGKPLSESTRDWFQQEVATLYPGSPVHFLVDDALLGGVKIRLGEREIDHSFKGRMFYLVNVP